MNSPSKGVAVKKLSESKALSHFIKEAHRQAMIEAPGSSSAFIEVESSPLVASELENTDIAESKVVPKGFANFTEPLHERLAEASATAQDKPVVAN